MRKLFDNIKPVYSLDAETYTAVTVGAHVVDTQGYGDGMLLVLAGDITTHDRRHVHGKVMECDTSDGTFTASGITYVRRRRDRPLQYACQGAYSGTQRCA